MVVKLPSGVRKKSWLAHLRVIVGPRDHASPVNACRVGVGRAWRIKRCDRAVTITQDAVAHGLRVTVVSRDGSFPI